MDVVNEFNQKLKSGVEQIKEKSKTKQKKNFTINTIKQANSKLETLKISLETYQKSDRAGAEANLKNIKKNVTRILKDIEKFHK